MLKKIAHFIAQQKLLEKDKKYIVALSGGADSVCLLLVLQKLGYDIEAAHCNFKLRGTEADRDEQFCIELCKKHDIKIHLAHFDTNFYATSHKISIEMAARELRYSYFENLRRDICADAVCVAHHKNDCAETVILNLIRGTAIRGLAGIQPKRDNIIRPLLCVSRDEIECFLKEEGQEYMTDSTNLDDLYVRNKIRLNIIPMMEKINPAAVQNIMKTAIRINEANKVFDHSIEEASSRVSELSDDTLVIDIPKLKSELSTEYTLFYILRNYGFNPDQIEAIAANIDAPTGTIYLSDTHQLLFDRGRMIVTKLEENTISLKIPETGNYVIGEDRVLKIDTKIIDDTFEISKACDTATLNADKVRFPLLLRNVKSGDRFVPFGMKGSKLVSDYLTDKHYSLNEKQKKLVVEDAEGRIIWLVGERTDNRFKIDADTKQALIITLTDK